MADFPDETVAKVPSLGSVRWIFNIPADGDHTKIDTQLRYERLFDDGTMRPKEMGDAEIKAILTGPEKLAIKNALEAPYLRLSSRFPQPES